MKKSKPALLSAAMRNAVACVKAKSEKIVAKALFLYLLLLSSPVFSQINISGSQGQQATSDGSITPLFQKVYNVLSIFVVLIFIIYLVKPIKGLMSSEAGSQAQDGEKKAHMQQIATSIIAVLIWWFGVPYFLQLAFK